MMNYVEHENERVEILKWNKSQLNTTTTKKRSTKKSRLFGKQAFFNLKLKRRNKKQQLGKIFVDNQAMI